jgi:AcrR family transcriptional regulator
MKEVAERAGVSLRTVYNHFPDRFDLLDALGRTFDEQSSAMGGPHASDLGTSIDLASAVRASNRTAEALSGLSEAFAQLPLADIGRDEERVERTKLLVGHIASLMPATPNEVAEPIAIVLRHLLSHRSWFWLTREYGLTTEDVTELVLWTIDVLTTAAESGNRPNLQEST